NIPRRRHRPLLPGPPAPARAARPRAAAALGERARVAGDLLPLVRVALEDPQLAVLLLHVLAQPAGLGDGALQLRPQLPHEPHLGVRVAHARLERLDLEKRRAERVLALLHGPARLAVLLPQAPELL